MKIALEKHLVVHGAKLPWQCDHCPEGFMKSSDYKEHCNKVHDNFRPFPCHICGKRLSNLGILKNHQGKDFYVFSGIFRGTKPLRPEKVKFLN